MALVTIVRENWLTRKQTNPALELTLLVSLGVVSLSAFCWLGLYGADQWMQASPILVLQDHQYWRLWTTLFSHSDLNHLINNLVLFIPISYLLIRSFSVLLFPLFGFFLGGIVNLLVLKTMPNETYLIGMSGVVYWMGASWLTLFTLLDTRKTFKRRFSISLFLSLILFSPQIYKPEISYLSHLLGFVIGIISSILYFYINRKKFQAAELIEQFDEDFDIKFEQGAVPLPKSEISTLQD